MLVTPTRRRFSLVPFRDFLPGKRLRGPRRKQADTLHLSPRFIFRGEHERDSSSSHTREREQTGWELRSARTTGFVPPRLAARQGCTCFAFVRSPRRSENKSCGQSRAEPSRSTPTLLSVEAAFGLQLTATHRHRWFCTDEQKRREGFYAIWTCPPSPRAVRQQPTQSRTNPDLIRSLTALGRGGGIGRGSSRKRNGVGT